MDYESYLKIKKHSNDFLQDLLNTYSKKAWFMCYHLTGEVTSAAPLLINAFKETLNEISYSDTAPKSSFKILLYSNIYKLLLEGVEDDEEFEDLPIPQTDRKFEPFIREFDLVSKGFKNLYIMHLYNGLSVNELAEILNETSAYVQAKLQIAFDEVNEKRPASDRNNGTELIRLSTEFRNPNDVGFSTVVVPDYIMISLCHSLNIKFSEKKQNKDKIRKKGLFRKDK